jgi:hypothetical protein
MSNFKAYISILLGICVGSLLYVILNLIPIIGPLLVGITSGKISNGGLKRGFFVGLLSGIIGYLLVLFIFSQWIQSWNIIGKLFVGTLLLLWNFFGIILTGIGGVIGVIFFPFSKRGGVYTLNKSRKKEGENNIKTFVVCKKCKTANPKGENKYCSSCGEEL